MSFTPSTPPRSNSAGGYMGRRSFLRATVLGAAGAGLTGMLSACGSSSGGGASGGGSLTAQVFPTALQKSGQLLKTYQQQYGRSASAITVPGDYYSVTETRFLGGRPPFSTLDFDPGYLVKFEQNGWIDNLEGLPGIGQLKADMYDTVRTSLTGSDGKLYGLPYYTNIYAFFYNEQLLGKYGLKPATQWDELADQAVFLKGKGIQSPVVPVWTTEYNLTQATFIAECISRGMPAQFDASLNPLWDTNPIALSVLNFWSDLQNRKLVPPNAVTIDNNQAASVMGAGKSAYFWFNGYELQTLNNKDSSTAAGNIHLALMPGPTHGTSTFTAPTFQAKKVGNRDEAWTLTSFLSGLDKHGAYTGPIQRTAIGLAALTGYQSVNKDPVINKAWGAWASASDLDVMQQQLGLAHTEGSVLNAAWYPQYAQNMAQTLSQFLSGQVSAAEALQRTASYTRNLKAS